jgi:hypothetical protein
MNVASPTSDVLKRNAIARLYAGKSDYKTEAQKLGVNIRTLKRWVSTAKSIAPKPDAPPDVTEEGPSPEVTPSEEGQKNPVLDKLLEGESGAGKPEESPTSPGAVQRGVAEMEEFCVQGYAGIKSTVGSLLTSWRFTPPLDPNSPEVLNLFRVGVTVATTIKLNAPLIYPILTRYMSNWGALIGIVAADAFGMMMALEGMAKSKGWTPKTRKDAERAARADVPSATAYAEQLRPQTASAPSASTESAEQRGAETVVNAPRPTPEQIEEYNRVARAMGGPLVPVN